MPAGYSGTTMTGPPREPRGAAAPLTGVIAERLDRMLELDLALVDLVALRGQRRRRCPATVIEPKSLPSSPALPVSGQRDGRRAARPAARPRPSRRCVPGAARPGLRGDALLVALGGLVGQAVRQQEVAGVARASPAPARRPCRGTSRPRAGSLPSSVVSSGGRRRSRRRKSSQVSASPSERRARPERTATGTR